MGGVLALVLAGVGVALIFMDGYLTRDGIRRSEGRIYERNRLMVWFMRNDWRAAFIVTLASTATVGVVYGAVYLGVWYVGVVYSLVTIWVRGRVVVKNYRLNVKVIWW